MESLSPKPTSISAILPEIPKIVIKKRFLYRKRFLSVDFHVKFRCFQKSGIRSSRILLPSLGAGGRISDAGVSASAL